MSLCFRHNLKILPPHPRSLEVRVPLHSFTTDQTTPLCSVPPRCIQRSPCCFLLSISVYCCRWIGRCQCFVYFSTYRWNKKNFSDGSAGGCLEVLFNVVHRLLISPTSNVVVKPIVSDLSTRWLEEGFDLQ